VILLMVIALPTVGLSLIVVLAGEWLFYRLLGGQEHWSDHEQQERSSQVVLS